MPKSNTTKENSSSKESSKVVHYKLRATLVVLLIILGSILSANLGIVRWTEQQILNADGWVEVVGPLPKNDQIASAIGTHAVTQLFESVDVRQKLTDVLPENIAFLAAPLTSQLQTQANNLAKNFIQSDQFQSVWIAANRQANTRLVNSARGIESEPLPIVQKAETKFNLDLGDLKGKVIERLGQNNSGVFSGSEKIKKSAIVVGLKTKYDNFKRFVNTIDFMNAVLPLAILATFLGAAAIAIHRQRAVLWSGVGIMIVSTLQVIGLNALRPQIINMVENNLYRPAAETVWSALINPFNSIVRTLFIAGFAIMIIAILFGPYKWAKALRQKLRLSDLLKTNFATSIRRSRYWVEKNKRYIWATGGVVMLIFLTFYPSISWLVTVKTFLCISIFVALVELYAFRSFLITKKEV